MTTTTNFKAPAFTDLIAGTSNNTSQANDGTPKPKLKFTATNADDAIANITAPVYLINEVLEVDAHGIICGESMSLKTFVTIAMVHSICTGADFMGHKVYTTGKVLVVTGEGKNGFNRRLSAKAIDAECNFKGNLIHLDNRMSLKDKSHLEALRELIEFHKVVLVVFDTFSSLSGGVNENDNSEVANVMQSIQTTCKTEWGTSSLIVHHTGKDAAKGGRGASAFFANADFFFMLMRERKDLLLTTMFCQKLKDEDLFKPIAMMGVSVDLFNGDGSPMIDQEGKRKNSLSIRLADETTKMMAQGKTKKELTDRQLKALEALSKIIDGDNAISTPDIVKERFSVEPKKAPEKVAHVDAWRDAFNQAITIASKGDEKSTNDAKLKAFNRALSDLEKVGKIGAYGGYVWKIATNFFNS